MSHEFFGTRNFGTDDAITISGWSHGAANDERRALPFSPEAAAAGLTDPVWLPFAAEVVARLRFNLGSELNRMASGYTDFNTAPRAAPPPEPAKKRRMSGKGADADGFSFNDGNVDPHHPTAAQLLLALRLAATFGSCEVVDTCLAPQALTMLSGLRLAEVKPVLEVLDYGLLPPETRTLTMSRRSPSITPDLVLCAPETDGHEISRFNLRTFHEDLVNAFDSRVPVLILWPDEEELPADIARFLPAPFRLVPTDRAILLELLRLTHGDLGTFEAGAILAALPDDRALGDLSPLALKAALRASSALEAARQLADLLRPAATVGPSLDDLSGDGEALAAARRLVADLGLWKERRIGWNELCRSMLMFGPPGTGKTWLARAMGASAGVDFIATSFAEWQAAGHLGNMLAAMQKSFTEARRRSPSILFIDEIDSVGSRLSSDRHGANYSHQVINGFLEQMDRISREEGVIVIGACNFPERIDPAVLRAGRFDLKIEVPLPDGDAIFGMLRRSLGEDFPEADMRALARAAIGRSSADVDAAVRKARSAARSAGRALRLEDIRAEFAPAGPAREAVEWRTAVHECGHAFAAIAFGRGSIERLTLTPEGGITTRMPVDDEGLLAEIESEMAYLMAGRAAERLVFGEVSAGAGGPEHSDLAKATALAVMLDTRFGLGAYGSLWIDGTPDVLLRDPEVRDRVRTRVDAAEARAGALLARHKDRLEAMARVLVRERLLTGRTLIDWLVPLSGVASSNPE
ncbi:AAA family ATPase [Cereibacter sphaeroides]|uniref:AAA family ATPase n=1 Tax=Cereibacter sphaeroides TaxID=1063 RepID=UPI001F1FBC77|nr:AAA family ATPase [Cereibacter sphaeroides]MCE6950126.1 AAA family ATPase [Cereibacter sphaeroides]